MTCEADELKKKLDEIMCQLKEAVDSSLYLKQNDPQGGRFVSALWEEFLRQFFLYVKKRGKETNQNLMAGISIHRVIKN